MSYVKLWKSIFPNHYKEKYKHWSGLSGGGGNYPFYDIHICERVSLMPNEFKLSFSEERFVIPKDIYLLTGNKSTLARQGIEAHLTRSSITVGKDI